MLISILIDTELGFMFAKLQSRALDLYCSYALFVYAYWPRFIKSKESTQILPFLAFERANLRSWTFRFQFKPASDLIFHLFSSKVEILAQIATLTALLLSRFKKKPLNQMWDSAGLLSILVSIMLGSRVLMYPEC